MLKTDALAYQRIIAGCGAIVCGGILMLAVPRFIASLYALYPEAAYQQTQQKLPAAVYEKSIADLNLALAWYKNPQYWQKQAFFYVELFNADPSPSPEKKQQILKQAQASIFQGLKLSPVDPYSWFRLAAVDKMLNAPSAQIINALRLSIYAGRVEPELVMSRLSLGYEYYYEFNEEMLALWEKQIPVAWAFQPTKLVEFVSLNPEAKHLVEQALAHSPDDLKKFSDDLEILLQKTP